jgi:LPXTG-motif cell wall-anchored protein
MKKQILSVLLCLCMAVCLLPAAAFAAAPDALTIQGGAGGDGLSSGGCVGGQGGYIKDSANGFWAAGGGGGGCSQGWMGTSTSHLNGYDGSADQGGAGGSPNRTNIGGIGGAGKRQSGDDAAGSQPDGSAGGAGGGFASQTSNGFTYSAEGGQGGITLANTGEAPDTVANIGNGGNGGNAEIRLSGGSYTDIGISGGNGGTGKTSITDINNGGNGGNAKLTSSGDLSLTGALTVSSGSAGTYVSGTTGGTGGAAGLQCTGSITAPAIQIAKKSGAVDVDIATLNVTENTTITVDGTAAADVVLGTVNVAKGKTLTVNRANNGKLTINTLNIEAGGSVSDTGAAISPAVSLSAGTLADAAAGTAYSQSIAAYAGGVAPYTFTLDTGSSLPAGLTLSAAGEISGTPAAAVSGHSFTVKVLDALGRTATQTYALTVADSYGIALDPAADQTFTSATSGYGAQTAYTVTVNNSGTAATGDLTAALSGTNADCFTLSKTAIGSIAANGSDSFTVVPNTGLAAGTYTAVVTVDKATGNTNAVAAQSFHVTFAVAKPTYAVTLPTSTGYTAAPQSGSASPVTEGGSFSFTVVLDKNYEKAASFAVKANGAALTETNGVYTIANITSAEVITVEGVVRAAAAAAVTSPLTGDTSRPALWIGLLLLSGSVLAVTVKKRRKSN